MANVVVPGMTGSQDEMTIKCAMTSQIQIINFDLLVNKKSTIEEIARKIADTEYGDN